jgi:hypothetical protein
MLVIAYFVFSSLATIILFNLLVGSDRLLTQIVRFSLTVGLCWRLYQGRNWARIVLAFLAGLAGIMGIFGGLGVFATTGNPFAFLLIVQAIFYFACFGILLFFPAVRAYFKAI